MSKMVRVRALKTIQVSPASSPVTDMKMAGQEFEIELSRFSHLSMEPVGWDPSRTRGAPPPPLASARHMTKDERLGVAVGKGVVMALIQAGIIKGNAAALAEQVQMPTVPSSKAGPPPATSAGQIARELIGETDPAADPEGSKEGQ